MGRVIDKTTGETVFIDPDPNALKISFRKDENEDWRSLELTYVDEEGKFLNVRDGSGMGVWVSIDQVHLDNQEAALEFGRNLERHEYAGGNKGSRRGLQPHQAQSSVYTQ